MGCYLEVGKRLRGPAEIAGPFLLEDGILKDNIDRSMQDACKECSNWDEVGHQARVRSVLTTMVDKVEEKVTDEHFKPTVGDFLKVLEAERDLGRGDQGPKELHVKWEEPEPNSQN